MIFHPFILNMEMCIVKFRAIDHVTSYRHLDSVVIVFRTCNDCTDRTKEFVVFSSNSDNILWWSMSCKGQLWSIFHIFQNWNLKLMCFLLSFCWNGEECIFSPCPFLWTFWMKISGYILTGLFVVCVCPHLLLGTVLRRMWVSVVEWTCNGPRMICIFHFRSIFLQWNK